MEDFAKKLEEMEQNPQIQKLKQFPQHDGNNTFSTVTMWRYTVFI